MWRGPGERARRVVFLVAKLDQGVVVEKAAVEKPCKSCGAPLAVSSGGRPADYCSTACRRMAEFAIRRVSKRLENLEARLSGNRISPDGLCWWQPKADTIAALEAEIALQTDRLRELLAE